jgi:hypothetical protein
MPGKPDFDGLAIIAMIFGGRRTSAAMTAAAIPSPTGQVRGISRSRPRSRRLRAMCVKGK